MIEQEPALKKAIEDDESVAKMVDIALKLEGLNRHASTHAAGVVIGETCVVGDDVSILQNVTLGGTGKQRGDRHPKIGRGVLISVGAKILGNIKVGDDSRIAAGSVVLHDVPKGATVAGVPAKVIRGPVAAHPSVSMEHFLGDGI